MYVCIYYTCTHTAGICAKILAIALLVTGLKILLSALIHIPYFFYSSRNIIVIYT